MLGAQDEFRACEVLKNSPKWYLIPPVKPGQSSKCSETSSGMPELRSSAGGSDAHSYIHLNDFNNELEFEEPQELQHPPRRDKSKATSEQEKANRLLQQQILRVDRVDQVASPNMKHLLEFSH
ncbi:hypothetical protein HanPI659440_Chr12g0473271 [Helianthus annuus]|nr:hypothetical protein HanPI659440_Chr12g0473271 [Helianthus annuus]